MLISGLCWGLMRTEVIMSCSFTKFEANNKQYNNKCFKLIIMLHIIFIIIRFDYDFVNVTSKKGINTLIKQKIQSQNLIYMQLTNSSSYLEQRILSIVLIFACVLYIRLFKLLSLICNFTHFFTNLNEFNYFLLYFNISANSCLHLLHLWIVISFTF